MLLLIIVLVCTNTLVILTTITSERPLFCIDRIDSVDLVPFSSPALVSALLVCHCFSSGWIKRERKKTTKYYFVAKSGKQEKTKVTSFPSIHLSTYIIISIYLFTCVSIYTIFTQNFKKDISSIIYGALPIIISIHKLLDIFWLREYLYNRPLP